MKLDTFLANSIETVDDLQKASAAEGRPPLPAAGSPQDQLRDLCLTDAPWSEIQAFMATHALDINAHDSQGQTVLTATAAAGHLSRVKDLVELGKADPNVADAFGDFGCEGPLYAAALAGSTEIVQFLLEHGASLITDDSPPDYTLLIDVIERKFWEVAKLLVIQMPDPSMFGEVVVYAVDGGSLELVELLLSRGASPDEFSDLFLDSALGRAIATRNVDMLRLLLRYGATLQDLARGEFPIIEALKLDPAIGVIVRLLLDHGAPLTSDTFKDYDAWLGTT